MSTLTFNQVKEIREKVTAMSDYQLGAVRAFISAADRQPGKRSDYDTAYNQQVIYEYEARERERQGLPKYPTGEDE